MELQSVQVYALVGRPWAPEAPNTGARAPIPPERRMGCIGCIKRCIKRAVKVYEGAMEMNSANAVALARLACTYQAQGLIEQAIEANRNAIALKPDFADAYCNLGSNLKQTGKTIEAEECFTTALRYCPNHASSLNNLGNICRDRGDVKEAESLYRKALRALPSFGPAHSNLGVILQQRGDLEGALVHHEEAIKEDPIFPEAYNNLGNTLEAMENLDDAFRCYSRAVEINPTFACGHSNLGSLNEMLQRLPEAIEAYKTALELKPDYHDAFCNLVHCLQTVCDWTDYDQRLKKLQNIVVEQLESGRLPSVHPHHSILYPLSHKVRKAIAERYTNCYLQGTNLDVHFAPFSTYAKKEGRLKIGYFSSDFGHHPTSHLMQSIPGLHDKSRFEIFCYALRPDDGSAFRAKIQKGADHLVDLSDVKRHYHAARRIHTDGIHILVDLNGFTQGSRTPVLGFRPAPIQALWLGYPGTSGTSFIDYLITDEVACPLEYSTQCSEMMAYLPHSYFIGDHNEMFPHIFERIVLLQHQRTTEIDELPFTRAVVNAANFDLVRKIATVNEESTVLITQNGIPTSFHLKTVQLPVPTPDECIFVNGVEIRNGLTVSKANPREGNGEVVPDCVIITTRQQYGLPEDAIVFCCFNQLCKIDPYTFKIWMNILRRVPNSVLWLLRFPPLGEVNLKVTAEEWGIPPSRIIFSELSGKEEHVRRAQLADICLDTPLCNGHTTSMDVLWAGTPVVTLPGETMASRVAASQLTTLGMPELVAKTRKEYEDLAVRLGKEPKYLREVCVKLWRARKNSSLFDVQKYVDEMEKLFFKMWDIYESRKEMTHIWTS